jgi:hypothetical protein
MLDDKKRINKTKDSINHLGTFFAALLALFAAAS